TGTSDPGNTGDGGDAASSSLGFTPSNVDVSKLDLTGIGNIDLIGPGCCIGSDGSGFRCGDSTMAKYTVITQPNQIKVGVYVARSWRIEPNASITVCNSFPLILVATDKIDILGSLTAAAMGGNAVVGGFSGGNSDAPGLGPGGGGTGSTANAGGGASY